MRCRKRTKGYAEAVCWWCHFKAEATLPGPRIWGGHGAGVQCPRRASCSPPPGSAPPPALTGVPPPLAPAPFPSKSATKGNCLWLSKLLCVNLHPSGFMHRPEMSVRCRFAFTLIDRPAARWCWDVGQHKCWSLAGQQPTSGRFSITFTFPGHCHCQLLLT